MKRMLTIVTVALLFAATANATYIVVLKNGTQYKAKQKWTIVNGKAMVQLENGQVLQLDPSLIDETKSEQTTRLGLGNARMVDLDPNLPKGQQAPSAPSLGSSIKLRKLPEPNAPATPAAGTAATPAPATPPLAAGGGSLGADVIDKFGRAYENVGIFEQKLTASGPNTLRAELTTDTEDKVFNAITATSFLVVRNAGTNARIDMVELFLKMTNGGAAGRFQMTRADAEALDKKTTKVEEYFVRKVLY